MVSSETVNLKVILHMRKGDPYEKYKNYFLEAMLSLILSLCLLIIIAKMF